MTPTIHEESGLLLDLDLLLQGLATGVGGSHLEGELHLARLLRLQLDLDRAGLAAAIFPTYIFDLMPSPRTLSLTPVTSALPELEILTL
jgi:hypothetical protein